MLEFKMTDVSAVPYLYVEKSCSMDPTDVSAAMGVAFEEVMRFIAAKGIRSSGQPLAVYYTYDPDVMAFRAGFTVSEADVVKASGRVKGDQTPDGKVLSFVHKGPYETLRDSYDEMMAHVAKIGRKLGAPTWEIYVDDPGDTEPEDLRTEVYVTLN